MNYKLFIFFQTQVLFISDKEYISQSTRKVKTQKTIMCSSWSKRHSSPSNLLFLEKTLISVLTNQKKLNHSWFQKRTEQTIHSVISNVRIRTNHHQMQMLILNRLGLKTRLFSNTVSSNNGVFKGKVFKQKRDTTTNWKSHQENFDSQNKITLNKTQQ